MSIDEPSGRAKFLRQSGLSIGLRVSWAALNYLGVLLLARWFTAPEYGIYALLISVVTFLAVFCGLGARTATVRFLGQYKASKDTGLTHGVLRLSVRAVLTMNLVVLFLALACIWAGWLLGMIEQPWVYSFGLLLLPAFSLADTFSGISRSFNSLVVALAPRDVFWRAGIIGLAFVFTLPAMPVSIRLELFLAASAILLTLLVLWQARRSWEMVPDEIWNAQVRVDRPQWFGVAWPIWLASVATVLFRTFDVMALGLVLDPADVGYYFAASRLATLTSFVLNSINQTLGPQISRAYHGGDTMRLQRLLTTSAVVATVPALCLFFFFIFAGEWTMSFFGAGFIAFTPILIVLSAGHVVSSFCGSAGLLLDLTGHERANTRILLSTSVLSSFAMVAGAFLWGAIGTAVAAALGLAIWNLRRAIYAHRSIGIPTTALSALQKRRN